MLHIKIPFETRIIRGNKVRYYFDHCPHCGIEIKRRIHKMGSNCDVCNRTIWGIKNANIVKSFVFNSDVSKERKYQCRSKTRRAVKSGKIKKLPCKVCGSMNSEAHHTDYNDWFNPTWVCHKHHLDLHLIKKDI